MRDLGHEWTTERIVALEKRIRSVFEEASIDAQVKLNKFIRKYRRDEKMLRAKLQKGEITEATYRDWLAGQIFQGKRWRAMLSDLAQTMTNGNEIAMDIINGEAPKAFAYNANWAAFEIERAGNADMGFGLYDQSTVARLLRDEPTLLPPSRVDIPEDEKWNMKLISRQVSLGIIEGEALDAIAKRLQRVATMNFNSARTHARTAMTGAQNAGRIETYRRAERMDIKLQKEWLATLDTHTRHSHAALDGQRRPVDEPFDSELGKIMYPGDPAARPANVYNCRCTLISHLIDYPSENAQRRDDRVDRKPIKDMTFAEWAGWKKSENAGSLPGNRGIMNAKKEKRKAQNAGATPEQLFDRKARTYTADEDLKAVNPNFATGAWKWTNNCQRCVPAYEMRKRGYRVTANPIPSNRDEIYLDYTLAWEERTKTWCHAGSGKEQIELTMKHWGDGSRAEVHVAWKRGGGHVFVAEQINGSTHYYDPQNGSDDASEYFKSCAIGRTTILRIDNNTPSDLITDCCKNGGE